MATASAATMSASVAFSLCLFAVQALLCCGAARPAATDSCQPQDGYPYSYPTSVQVAITGEIINPEVSRKILGCHSAGKDYTFEAWLLNTPAPTAAFVELRHSSTNATLARANFTVTQQPLPPWSWAPYRVTLTPNASTSCAGILFGSDARVDCGNPHGSAEMQQLCVRCTGEVVLGVVGSGARANVGYVTLTPGDWGLLHDSEGRALPVLRSAADRLTEMGITVIRSGGTVSQSLRWKDWRGPLWDRPSSLHTWGASHVAEWGPFEVLEMAEALDIEAVLTLSQDANTPGDWADLVEYCWGDNSTSWGRQRTADRGHPGYYKVVAFELGNEQYNPNFVKQMKAMEERAAGLGVHAPPLWYIVPTNSGLPAADAQAALDAGLDTSRILADLHVGAGGAVEAARSLFSHPVVPGFQQGAACLETNAGTHNLQRALDEAADLLEWMNLPSDLAKRLYARTASFCSGTQNGFDTWDQGLSFFMPNMTWLQPPGHVHAGLSLTWASTTLGHVTQPAAAILTGLTVSTQMDRAREVLVIRTVNQNSGPVCVTVSLASPVVPEHGDDDEPTTGRSVRWTLGSSASHAIRVWQLSGLDPLSDNTPAQPARVAPVQFEVPVDTSIGSFTLELPALSFTIARLRVVADREPQALIVRPSARVDTTGVAAAEAHRHQDRSIQ